MTKVLLLQHRGLQIASKLLGLRNSFDELVEVGREIYGEVQQIVIQ